MYILVHTTYHWCNSFLGEDTCQFSVLVHNRYKLLHTWYILVCNIYVLVHASTYIYVLVHTRHKLSTYAFVPTSNHQHREDAYPHLQTCSPSPQGGGYLHDAAASGAPSATNLSFPGSCFSWDSALCQPPAGLPFCLIPQSWGCEEWCKWAWLVIKVQICMRPLDIWHQRVWITQCSTKSCKTGLSVIHPGVYRYTQSTY